MFSVPSTPASQTRSATRSRYNSDTSSAAHSSSYPPIDPVLNQQSTPTRTRHTNSVSSVRDNITSPSVSASSPSQQHHQHQQHPPHTSQEAYSAHTPFVSHAAPPSNGGTPRQGQVLSDDSRRQVAESPTQMPGYHPDTPSPPATFGISGLIVSNDTPIMPSGNGPECQPLIPSQPDVFMTGGKTSRPVLRPSLSHNSALTPNSATGWSRSVNSVSHSTRGAPISTESATVGGVLSATYPNTPLSQQGSTHEASAPFSHPSHPVTTHSSSTVYASAATPQTAPPAPPHHSSSSHHHSSSHTHNQPMSIATGTPFSDPEVSFQSSAYAGSYDSSYGSNSPWTPQSAGVEYGHYHHHHPYYSQMVASKIEEPILAPGEVPAPRPPMSYAALIGEALLLAPPPHQLYVSEISDSIKKRYAYYRQNPTKVYNGVRHQTSMCKAFVKLPRPFGDQTGGARKWAIRAGCETHFQGGGYHPPGSNAAANMKHKSGSPPAHSNGKAKQTARSKQLAIGTSTHSPKLSTKVKSEPYIAALGAGGPSVGPAYDGTSKPYYPPYGLGYPPPAPHNPYGGQHGHGGYYAYQPIHYGPNWSQPTGAQGGGLPPPPHWQQGGYGAGNPPSGPGPMPGSPASQNDPSPQVNSAASHGGYPYGSYAYAQPGPPHPYAIQGDYKPYVPLMATPHTGHHSGFPQSDERPNTQGSHGSPASYDGKPSPNASERHQSAELSPRH